MIISNSRKYIFVAIPKTATHAIRFALRPYLDEAQDWEHVSKYVNKRIPIPELAAIQHGHLRCTDIRPVLDASVWSTYFKFAIVRNPYDRFISSCCFLYRNSEEFQQNPLAGMHAIADNDEQMQRVLLWPQTEFICDTHGAIDIDYIGRYETLEASYRHVCDMVGIPAGDLEAVNVTGRNLREDHMDDALRAKIRRRYARDFDLLGYPG